MDIQKPRLIDNWRAVITRAWSVRLMIAAAILSGLEVFLPLAQGWLPVSPGVFAALSFVTVVAAFVARFTAQRGITNG